MKIDSSGRDVQLPGATGQTAEAGGRENRAGADASEPVGMQEWRRKWRPLSGRIPAERRGVFRWQRHFAGTPEQVCLARRFTHFLLADSAVAADAAWVTGELATNAIRHARSGDDGGVFTVEVLRWRHFVQVQVTDAGGYCRPVLPATDPAAGDDGMLREGGLGLYGIGALACRFGTYQHSDGSRVVWARLETDPPRIVGVRR